MIERVLDTIKTVLDERMTIELGKQDGINGGGIVCDSIASIQVGDDTPPNTGLPAIIIKPEGAAEVNYSVSGKKDVTYSVYISATVTDTDEDRSQRKLWRTLRAIECALEVYLIGKNDIIDYKTVAIDYVESTFGIVEGRSTEKSGILQTQVKERLSAYVEGQV